MPASPLKDLHLPELHLPEMSREDIVRAFGDARRDVDLSRFDPRRVDLTRVELPKVDLPRVELPDVDLSKIDVPGMVRTAAQAVGIVKPRRSRLPFIAGGVITVALVGYAVATSPLVRPRLDAFARRLREGIEARREAMRHDDADVFDAVEPRAFDAAVAVPIEPSAFADSAPMTGSPLDGSSPLPEGLGRDVARV